MNHLRIATQNTIHISNAMSTQHVDRHICAQVNHCLCDYLLLFAVFDIRRIGQANKAIFVSTD